MAKVILEVESEGQQPVGVEVPEGTLDAVLNAVRQRLGNNELHVFEKDSEEELHSVQGRTALSLVVHRCKKLTVQIHFDTTKSETFSPAVKVFTVLRWAIGKKGFNLDSDQQAKVNLMLPGADSPLPRDAAIGQFTTGNECSLTLELTLKDFTNG